MATGVRNETAAAEQWEITLCPRGCGGVLRPDEDDLWCAECGYTGDGTLPQEADGEVDSSGSWENVVFPETHVVRIYRCMHYYTARPEFEPIDIHVTVLPTTAATQKKGKRWRLLGIYGGRSAFWPDDLSPQMKKGGGMRKGAVTIRQELRLAILEAICIRLEVKPEQVVGLKAIIQADTIAHKRVYDREDRSLEVFTNGTSVQNQAS